jgi:FtsH-binding integral membrane protein
VFDRDRSKPDTFQPPPSPQPPATPPPGSLSPWAGQLAGRGAAQAGTGEAVVAREGFLTMSFVWMFLALVVSAATAAFVSSNARALELVIDNFWLLFIVQLGFVFVISAGINRLGAMPALALLFTYAILTGATLSIVVLAYTNESLLSAFLGASAIFGGAALYGVVTKRDLTSIGGILFMGLFGLIAVILVNAFLVQSSQLSLIIGIVGVIVFTGLTAYDVQRINNGELQWIKSREAASVVGALYLYLDLINLFLMLLRIFGSSRD